MRSLAMTTALIAPLLLLAACVETTAPLCDNGNKVDLPGFERDYALTVLADPTQDMKDVKLNVSRKGPGEYQLNGKDIVTCRVGRWVMGESVNSYGTYQQTILSQAVDGSASMNQMLIDKKDLLAHGVEFEIVEREASNSQHNWLNSFGLNATKQKVLLIKLDSAAAHAVISKVAKPSALGLFMY